MSNKPIQSSYYGVPVYFRVEHRKDGNVIVFSFRSVLDGKLVTEYEHPPRRIPALEALLADSEDPAVTPEILDGLSILEQLPGKTMEELFQCFLSTTGSPGVRNLGVNRRKMMQDLTLGALLAADKEFLLYGETGGGKGRTKEKKQSSIDDDARAIRLLCQREGGTRWRDVTPDHCAAWLQKETGHMRTSCSRIMRKLLLPHLEMRAIKSLLGWESYDPVGAKRPVPNYKSQILGNLLPTMLTYGHCRRLLQGIMGESGPERVTGIDMALLLNLVLGLSEEALCALDLDDFCYLNDFASRMTVNISKWFERHGGRTNYRLCPILDIYERRKLPLPHLAEQCFQVMRKRRKDTGSLPLVPSRANSRRRMAPDDLKKEFNKRLRTLGLNYNVGSERIKTPDLRKLLSATAERELRKSGCEEEELRFIFGKQPLIVSAKSYADFMNEAELNKLGALMDRWLNRVVPMCQSGTVLPRFSGKGATAQWSAGAPESRTQVSIRIPFGPKDPEEIPEEGITLEVSALHGFSGSITFQ